MDAVLKQSQKNIKIMQGAILASLCLHAMFIFLVPKFDYKQTSKQKQEITVELVKPEKKPEPPPPPPEPPKPKPIKPTPILPTPVKTPVIKQPEPVTVKPVATPPPVIAAAPTVESKPEVVVKQPPEPPKVIGPTEGEIEAARAAFKSAAHREIKKGQKYPKIAEMRGIEGDVKLEIKIDAQGNVTDVKVIEGSGSEALDNAAIESAKRANLKQHLQEILRGRLDSVTVTVSFKMAQ